ncbi:hypothetical protein DH2020_030562 [Rehmannia glutinosa]|uniref:Sodium channel modifier 1 acidic C-terminal domain-containing protein n=1 Tax=Rehmannia glutinosa TaxID=99300 RepID=A0ABR0VPH7_REHGL
MSGLRHRAAELRRKDRELAMEEEVNKRLALSDCVSTSYAANGSVKQWKKTSKPLIERARKAVSGVFSGEVTKQKVKSENGNLAMPSVENRGGNAKSIEVEPMHKGVVVEVQPVDYRERVEKELKFTAAGWKRDCHGRWLKDENVEFDSDEEDPNVVLNDIT